MGVRFLSVTLAPALAALIAIGCGGVTDPSKNTVETLQGTVSPGERAIFRNLNVSKGGEYSVKITALSPTPTAVLGVSWYQGGNCDFLMNSNFATLNQPALSGAIFQKGAYCLIVSDVGTLTVAQNFTVSVSHP
jgi:hypothetical protein